MLTTYAIGPHIFDTLLSPWTGVAEPAVREIIIARYMMPLMTQVVEFIVWSSAGAFISYLVIYRSLVNPKKYNLRQTGAVGLLVISLAAIAPPAIT